MKELEGLAGMGMETVDPSQDLSLSRLHIAQAISPQVEDDSAAYIEGLRPGELFDSTLGERLGPKIRFLPVVYRKRWVEWADRDQSQGGVVAIHETPNILDQCQPGARRDPQMRFLDNGNQIQETAYFFGWLVQDGGAIRDCYLAMTSTQLRKARNWLSLARSEHITVGGKVQTAPLFYRIYDVSTRKEQNSRGKWYGWHIERSKTTIATMSSKFYTTKELIARAREINESMDDHPLLAGDHEHRLIEAGVEVS